MAPGGRPRKSDEQIPELAERLLDWIVRYQRDWGYQPSQEEMMAAMGRGNTAVSSALTLLEATGRILRIGPRHMEIRD